MSSLNSVKYSYACEFIKPSPAMRVRAGLVPSSSGPFAMSSANATALTLRNAKMANPAKYLRIQFLLDLKPDLKASMHIERNQEPIITDGSVEISFRSSFVWLSAPTTRTCRNSLQRDCLPAAMCCLHYG